MKNDTYGEPVIFTKGHITARVYAPIITDEEQKRRMEQVKQAAARLLLSKEKGQKNGKFDENA